MKSSTKVLVSIVVVTLIGAGVYFGNTKLFTGRIGNIKTQLDLGYQQSEPIAMVDENDKVLFVIFYAHQNDAGKLITENMYLDKELLHSFTKTSIGNGALSNYTIEKSKLVSCKPFYLDLKLDPDNIYSETNEANNHAGFIFTISKDGKPLPGKNC